MAECPSASQLRCGVCQRPPNVPVMLSCWHPFCLGCIERVWCQVPRLDHGCPLCLNVPLPPSTSSPVASPSGVLCDFCLGDRPAASKTCLTCLASFCEEHLQPHLSSEMFRGHRLAEPSADLSARCCAEHGKALEMFCRDCRMCVCSMCPVLGRHQGHRVKLVDQEAVEKRNLLKICQNRLSCKTKQEEANIKQIQKASEELKVSARHCSSWLTQQFTEMRLLLDEEEKAAKELVETQSQAVLQVYGEQVQGCRQRIQTSYEFALRVDEIYKEDDAVQLLKGFTAAEADMQLHQQPPDQIHPVPLNFDPLHTYVGCFHKALKTILRKPVEQRVTKGLSSGPDAKQVQTLIHRTKSTGDKLAFLRYARSPILDADTAHPRLRVSPTWETVSKAWMRRSCSDGPQRFDRLLQMLARESYFAGRHYWEVDVRLAGQGWWVGVAYRSMVRRGDSESSRLGCNASSWCLKRFDLEYWAFHNSTREPVFLEQDPERLGVFLDYEAGTLSFYDALSGMRHLHTFQARFTEPLYPALRLWEGPISLCKLT
ncbi:tripartite motif-containing protein 14-like [Brienomyrus brachyistius]|uniref:tripartite motif-containing protein 14-like n=1 Tax=Brienomyrus brachyistius TaxID=42636 RepID=UPI0020B3F3D3|nr:tripartite motif-containing protein 14-like [Brienomyrus brachyistius]